jgi:hypothetical protein
MTPSARVATTTATAATAMATMSSHPWRPEWMGDGGEFDWRVWIRVEGVSGPRGMCLRWARLVAYLADRQPFPFRE